MTDAVEIRTYLLKWRQLLFIALGLFIFMMTGCISTALIVRSQHLNSIILWLGFAIFFIFPLILLGYKTRLFTKKAAVKLNNDSIIIDLVDKNGNTLKSELILYYRDIKAFQLSVADAGNSSALKLIMNNETIFWYVFFEQFKNNENISENIQMFFREYNEQRRDDSEIKISPNFSNTKSGKIVLYGLGILVGITILLLQIFLKPHLSSFPFFIGLAIYFLRIASLQKSDAARYRTFLQSQQKE